MFGRLKLLDYFCTPNFPFSGCDTKVKAIKVLS